MSQKKMLDSVAYRSWPMIFDPYLTANGSFFSYLIRTDIFSTRQTKRIVKSIRDDWQIDLSAEGDIRFLNHDRCLVKAKADSLTIYWLGSSKRKSIFISFYYIPDKGDNELVFYQERNAIKDLVVENLKFTSKRYVKDIGEVTDAVYLSRRGSLLVRVKSSEIGRNDLKRVDLKTGETELILKNQRISQIQIDNEEQIATIFIEGELKAELFEYSLLNGMLNRIKVPIDVGTRIRSLQGFSPRGDVLLELLPSDSNTINTQKGSLAQLEVLSYRDSRGGEIVKKRSEKGIFCLDKHGKISIYGLADEIGVVANESEADSIMFVGNCSPDKKYVVYNDSNKVYSYEISTGTVRNISTNITNNWNLPSNGDYDFFYEGIGKLIGWVKGENAILYKDEFDIWKLSLDNSKSPINLTNWYGRRHSISFFLWTNSKFDGDCIVDLKQNALFIAFNTKTKQNGFFSKSSLLSNGDPKLLAMDNAMFYLPYSPASFRITAPINKPVKAKNANIYVVAKSTGSSSQNFYLTKDFRNFKQLTNYNPERSYNWYSTQLVNWKTKNGVPLQGVLYKPEDFDSSRKYPVLFYSYRKASDNLNSSMIPNNCFGCTVDIPTYVNDGYLVFTPDIYFIKGKTGASALDAIESAVQAISKFPFVNSSKIGIQGCSFGGFTTNYIVTHTNVFTAACSASGLSDFISGYNSINKRGMVKQAEFESGPYQIGASLWDSTQLYIENSPVLNVNNLTTPLLLMHTDDDSAIPVTNAMEMFLGAKRLGKRIWFLKYGNKTDHGVWGNEGLDFYVRMKQFFDYYLKDQLPPIWMTRGDLLRNELVHDLGLDSSGIKP